VVEGMRSDCCGAMTEQIFLETVLLHFGMENSDGAEEAENPKSFCKRIEENIRHRQLKFLSEKEWEIKVTVRNLEK
jgi:hypothetical protein